ncbi:Uncharacterised protein [Vibrio cholerae]|nr:Uncharacterised protein [Vibrio cholerae]CSI47977.1 Uncharacterised protein [Vibrio cholerae]
MSVVGSPTTNSNPPPTKVPSTALKLLASQPCVKSTIRSWHSRPNHC